MNFIELLMGQLVSSNKVTQYTKVQLYKEPFDFEQLLDGLFLI